MTDIDQLKKAFQQAIATSASVAASNEPLTRRDAVQSGQVFSAPVVQGGLGSWVASSGYPLASVTPEGVQLGASAPSRNSFEMAPGLPGVPDVDFVPYNWNTNRFGGKGGALLGHPISWEVVGPTLKSPYCDWQWDINTAGANDVLTLVAGPNPLGGAPASVQAAYNYSASFDAEGGLYVLLTFTGENFTGSLTAGRNPITPTYKYRAPFEIFRVDSILGLDITLRSEKRLSDYYGIPANPSCRAITLIRPKVTRLAALPAPINGQGQANRIFVFMPPEVSATSEYNPPYDAGVGSWLGGGFDVAGALPMGTGADYGGTNPLPVPRPLAEVDGTVDTAAVVDPAKWVVNVSSVPSPLPPIVRVYGVSRSSTASLSNGTDANCLGYFYVTKTAGTSLTLRRVPEVDPDTGAVFWGNGPYYPGVGTVDVRVQFFESVESLFLDASLNYTKLAAARLANLIDPRTVGPSIAYRDTSGVNAVPASKPDRAIFNTKTGEDPGNLLDLGFRAVYFPAKVYPPGSVAPDFERPLDSEDLIINPSSPPSRQYIETDYSAGVAYLSVAPLVGDPDCQVVPDVNTVNACGTNNPRKEVVLFAACVPYSMEEGQTGDGIRLTASSLKSIEVGFGEDDLADVYGRRIILEPDVNQVLTPAPGASLTTTLADLSEIPPAGFFFLVGKTIGGLTNRRGPYYYQSASLTAGPPSVVSLDGISGPAGATAVNATGFTPDRIVLQRSLRSFAPTSASADTVRGSSKRISTLSFRGADVTFGADGSVSVEPRTTLQKAYEAGRAVSLSSTYGGPIRLSSSENVNFGAILEVIRAPSAVTDGAGISVTMGADTIAPGYFVSMDAAATGDGVRVTQDGSGDALRIYQNGAGYALDVIGPAAIPVFYVDNAGTTSVTDGTNFSVLTPTSVTVTDSVTNSSTINITNVVVTDGTNTSTLDATSLVVTDNGAPANTSTVNTTSVSVTDGTNTSTIDATSVTSGAFLYPVAPLQQISISPLSMRSGRYENVGTIVPPTRTSALLVNFTQEWRPVAQAIFGPPDFITELGYFSTTSRGLDGIIDLTPYLRTGMTIDQIDVHVNPVTAQATNTDRISVILYSRTVGGGGPTVLAGPIYDSGASGIQQITFPSLGVLVNLAFTTYYLVITSSQGANTLPGDAFHGVWLSVLDPGPRNY